MITTPADRYAADSLEKAQFARTCNELGEPWPAWSTGQHLAVAVLLQDMRKLAELDYTEVDALERPRYDIELLDLNAAGRGSPRPLVSTSSTPSGHKRPRQCWNTAGAGRSQNGPAINEQR